VQGYQARTQGDAVAQAGCAMMMMMIQNCKCSSALISANHAGKSVMLQVQNFIPLF